MDAYFQIAGGSLADRAYQGLLQRETEVRQAVTTWAGTHLPAELGFTGKFFATQGQIVAFEFLIPPAGWAQVRGTANGYRPRARTLWTQAWENGIKTLRGVSGQDITNAFFPGLFPGAEAPESDLYASPGGVFLRTDLEVAFRVVRSGVPFSGITEVLGSAFALASEPLEDNQAEGEAV